MLSKRRWVVATFLLTVVAVVGIYTFTMTPVYRSSATILIEKENPNILDIKELYTIDSTAQDFYQTQYRILESRFIAKRVIEGLGLGQSREFKSGGGLLGALAFWRKGGQVENNDDGSLVNSFLDRLKVEPIRNTRLALVHFESTNPKLAARTANAVVSTYIKHSLESKIQSVHGATEYLSQKIEEQRVKLEESEMLLQQYKEKFNIISLKEKENITVAKLAELNSDVLRAENSRVEAELRYKQAKSIEDNPELVESITSVVKNPFINKLKADEAGYRNSLSELSKKFGQKHPRIISITEKLRATREKLAEETRKIINSLKNEYSVALAREASLKKAFEKQKAESQRMGKHAISYGVLQRDVENNKRMYELLVTRLKEAGITGGAQTTNVRVIDPAEVPNSPVRPNKKLNMLFAVLLGLLGGIGLAFFFEYLDNTVKTPDDLKVRLDVPYLGPVPDFSADMAGTGEEWEGLLVAQDSPKASAAEAYRGLRTAIMFSTADREQQTLLISSAGPSEGKSLTSSNLAVTMAQAGTSTLLIDADFRKPMLHKIFGVPREKGFSNLIVGAAGLDEVIVHTGVSGLDIIPSGHIPPNPAELLGSDNIKVQIAALKKKYDRIIFDSPPIMPVTDAIVLSTQIDEVLLVVKAGSTTRELLGRAVEQLRGVRANILGAVLNSIKIGHEKYYYYQYYYSYSDANEKSGVKTKSGKKGKTSSA